MKRIKQYVALSAAPFIALVILFLPVIAEEQAPTPLDKLWVSVVTIDGKADKYNFIFVGERRFRVSHTAAILNYGGKSISLRRLPIPCRAKITYEMYGDHRDPMVLKIKLK